MTITTRLRIPLVALLFLVLPFRGLLQQQRARTNERPDRFRRETIHRPQDLFHLLFPDLPRPLRDQRQRSLLA